MFKNKHVVIAMIVAPILSILAWIAVGQFTGEKPHAARPGQSYPLVEKSNCRYASGACDLENEDFRLRLTLTEGLAGPELTLSASHALEGAFAVVVDPQQDLPPRPLRALDDEQQMWVLPLAAHPGADQRIRIVAQAGGSSWFGEVATAFLQDEDGND